ncbi:ATP-binding protein [Sagittula salina]|uniref:histidine kinase n=1 Tax=Sagittula salina TaxID=2820268 RepID=A0A940MTI4_9RHOB|nr:ATP-binding protein [Sagittula salina]MBP0484777.1 PAS domain S-box protein [Sagittula salina]
MPAPWKGSLLFKLRALIAACLVLSVVGLYIKNNQLRATELRARHLVQQTEPVTEVTRRVPALIERLNSYSRLVPSAFTEVGLEDAERGLAGIDALRSDGLLSDEDWTELNLLLSLQEEIVSFRIEIQARVTLESQRLDEIAWMLSSEQASLLAGVNRETFDAAAARGKISYAFELAAINASIAQAALATRDLQNADWDQAIRIKPTLLGEINVIATHLARTGNSGTRSQIARDLFDFKQAMFDGGGIFDSFSHLGRLADKADVARLKVERIITDLTLKANQLQRTAVENFQSLAVRNQEVSANIRLLDLFVTLGIGIGGIFALWGLIETKLFTRIERLVGHVRSVSEGITSTPIPALADDEMGELETAVEKARLAQRDICTLHRKIAAILKNAPCGIATLDAEGGIETANDALGKMFGHTPREVGEQSIFDLLAVPHESDCTMLPSTGGSVYKREHHVGPLGDKALILEVAIRRLDSEDQSLFIATFLDVTVRIAAQTTLQDALTDVRRHREELERSNKDLDQFAYAASHDLKAPLRVIRNGLRWIEQDLGENLDAEVKANLTLVQGRAVRMERLLEDLLTYSRIGRMEETPVKVSGAELLEDVVGLCDLPPGFKVEVGESMNTLVVDLMPLKNIFLNLISNAIKHHDRDSGVIRISVTIGEENTNLFEVADDGPGIPVEFHERVTQMFTTLKPRDQVEGSGMGLAFVKRQIDVKGGTLRIESGEGRGAAIRFTWPKDIALRNRSCGKWALFPPPDGHGFTA